MAKYKPPTRFSGMSNNISGKFVVITGCSAACVRFLHATLLRLALA